MQLGSCVVVGAHVSVAFVWTVAMHDLPSNDTIVPSKSALTPIFNLQLSRIYT